jgi:outer membrane protein assembly factor BamB
VANTRNYATPLIVGDRLVVYYENGSLDVLEAGTGERRSRTRVAKLGETGTPSPLLAADKLILGSEEGVLRAYTFADDPQLLGELRLEPHLATPLLVGERVFVRGLDHLFCIE